MKNIRFKIAQNDIIKLFNSLTNNIFTYSDISKIFTEYRDNWRLQKNLTTKQFIILLQNTGLLKSYTFQFPSFSKTIYIWRNASLYKILLSIKPNSYFSHYSAMFVHNLTEQIPKIYYLNIEQSQKPLNKKNSELTQEKIDFAFSRSQRLSKNIAIFDDYKICLLNGKYHNNLGVKEIFIDNINIFVTDIERTLIDITVRPEYSGGIAEVLKAFKNVKNRISLNRLQAYLRKMDFIYPYNQAIGFYLSKSHLYTNDELSVLISQPFKYNFYLGHKLSDIKYDSFWKIYYPSYIDL